MKLLYLSQVASEYAIDEARKLDSTFAAYAVQKFNRLIVEGFSAGGHDITALSTFYLPKVGLCYKRKNEIVNGVRYSYITSPNNSVLRHVWLIAFVFFRVLFWGMIHKKDKALICDALNISACLGAVGAARLIGLRCAGIVTDMPGLMVGRPTSKKKLSKEKINSKVNKSYLGLFTHYVFLTKQMNSVLNVNKRPFIVMEGLVDVRIREDKAPNIRRKKNVLYAGGLHERYGLRMLVEGFLKADVEGFELWVYGKGPFAEELQRYEQIDGRIHYCGVKPNREIVQAEKTAMLLVNPRPTHEEFTQYSFPSKNLEYMVSGTAVLTTRLPGMPEEYYPYLYIFDEETIDGYADTIREVLNTPQDIIESVGEKAKNWILENKDNVTQTGKIISLLNVKM